MPTFITKLAPQAILLGRSDLLELAVLDAVRLQRRVLGIQGQEGGRVAGIFGRDPVAHVPVPLQTRPV